MISSLSGMIMLWATGSPSSILQTPIHLKGVPIKLQHDLQLGLKTLIYKEAKTCHDQQQIIHSYKALASLRPPKTTPPSLSSTKLLTNYSSWSSSSLVLDDLIGTDSGVHILSSSNINIDDDIGKTTSGAENNKCNNKHLPNKDRIHDRRVKQWKKYPPPLPGLARTGNLACRMPWIWTRHYSEGKLVLQGQPLERHEYFEARRDDGRLTLDLVSIENHHQTKSRSSRSYCCEEELIQFGEDENNINGNEQSVADFESLSDQLPCLDGIISRDSTITPKCLSSSNYACGMFMDIHERSNPYSSHSGQATSSAPLVRPMTSVIM
ncbi:hypothetical protein L484_021522 [Morus notabilis]|uniref:FAF domain-containing protein n=1 Tax=Morus notabilis TaxID=981085 RepID=W9RSR3_9ROSA|nr:hypothetical protein L484_021522 [Morus notabilis]